MTTHIQAGTGALAPAGKYLTVSLAGEAYGITVLSVLEIIRLPKITPVPQTPDFVKGVIDLRGRVIPVIDLRVRFGLLSAFTGRTCIVVVQITRSTGQPLPMGLIVDSVEEVLSLSGNDINPIPDFGIRVDTSCLLGTVSIQGAIKTLLHIDRIIAPEIIDSLSQAA